MKITTGMKKTAKKKNKANTNKKSELKHHFDTWLLQHMQAFIFSLGQYIKNPIGNLLTTAVIGISLALPGSFYILLDNIRHVSSGWDNSLQITLFLKNNIDVKQANEFANQLATDNIIAETILIKREDALAEYRKLSGFAAALDALNENPLPNVILVKPAVEKANKSQTEHLIRKLETMPKVDSAQYDSEWIKRLLLLLGIINRIIIILSTLLAIAVLLIVGNTIRLSIGNHRAEIEITRLFGGTNRFIQRPFLYSGLWYGTFGSLIAWLIITLSIQMLHGPIRELAGLYASDFRPIDMGVINSLILIGIGITLGLMGSWISVKLYLHTITSA